MVVAAGRSRGRSGGRVTARNRLIGSWGTLGERIRNVVTYGGGAHHRVGVCG